MCSEACVRVVVVGRWPGGRGGLRRSLRATEARQGRARWGHPQGPCGAAKRQPQPCRRTTARTRRRGRMPAALRHVMSPGSPAGRTWTGVSIHTSLGRESAFCCRQAANARRSVARRLSPSGLPPAPGVSKCSLQSVPTGAGGLLNRAPAWAAGMQRTGSHCVAVLASPGWQGAGPPMLARPAPSRAAIHFKLCSRHLPYPVLNTMRSSLKLGRRWRSSGSTCGAWGVGRTLARRRAACWVGPQLQRHARGTHQDRRCSAHKNTLAPPGPSPVGPAAHHLPQVFRRVHAHGADARAQRQLQAHGRHHHRPGHSDKLLVVPPGDGRPAGPAGERAAPGRQRQASPVATPLVSGRAQQRERACLDAQGD